MGKQFWEAVKDRRTFYAISKEAVVSDERIQTLVEEAVKYTPSAFNSQSARVVILLGKAHDELWEITKAALQKIVSAENFAATAEKINSFQSGYGSLLYFEDMSVVAGLQEKFSTYKDNFPIWSQQASGMLQYVIWTALEAEGFGVSLQHYNELIEAEVKKVWDIPDNWKLIAQMPFGKPVSAPQAKELQPVEFRVKLYK
ncbi:MAG: nitroreductase family protein [Pelosinus sp.]|nr:nitroreductase family protein [Pelosinus sp.]